MEGQEKTTIWVKKEEGIQEPDSTMAITSNDVQKIEGVKKEEAPDFVLVPSSIKQEEGTQVPDSTTSTIAPTTDTDSNTNTTKPTNTTTTSTLDSNAATTNATTLNNQLAIKAEELKPEILRQVEYYFSPKNLVRDRFLQEQIAKDPAHFVPISVLITFNKLKALSTDIDFIADVLKSSKSLILSDDGKSVKTPIDVPLLSFPKPTVTICDKTFSSKDDMWIFYNGLLLKYKQGENLDEKDFNYLKDLIKFHEKAVEKIGVGIESIRVGVAVGFDEPSICFILKRKDGTEDNFSYNKCIVNIFDSPHQNKKNQNKKNNRGENQRQNKKRQRDEKLEYTPSCLLKIEADRNQEKSTSKQAETVESSDKMEISAETKNEQPQLQTQAEKVETSDKTETATATTEQPNDDKKEEMVQTNSQLDTSTNDKIENNTTTTQQPNDDKKEAMVQTNSQLDTSTKLNGKTLKDYFSKYGQVRWVDVREKSLIYVRFNNQESAKNALGDDGKIVGPSSKISLVTGDEEKIWYRENTVPHNNNSKFKRGGPHKKFKKF